MSKTLHVDEIRVLGVLIEKSLATPDSYPMTINAVRLAASQKQNRDPVAEYSDGQVSKALWSLQQKQLVKQAPPTAGSRSNKFMHAADEVFHWDKRERAIMAELMLRGRQTAGELRGRASRMAPLPDVAAVMHILGEFARTDPPFVEELPREPGRSTNRFRHLLAETNDTDANMSAAASALGTNSPGETPSTGDPETEAFSSPSGTAVAAHPNAAAANAAVPVIEDLTDRLEALEARVETLEETVGKLQCSLGETIDEEREPMI